MSKINEQKALRCFNLAERGFGDFIPVHSTWAAHSIELTVSLKSDEEFDRFFDLLAAQKDWVGSVILYTKFLDGYVSARVGICWKDKDELDAKDARIEELESLPKRKEAIISNIHAVTDLNITADDMCNKIRVIIADNTAEKLRAAIEAALKRDGE